MWSAPVRSLVVTSHVTTSVGWLGAVLAFLALSVAAVLSQDLITTQSAYVAMNLIGWAVIVPLALGSFASGVTLGLGTEWGLARHRWVLTKLIATILLLIGLAVHQITAVSRAAALAHRIDASVPEVLSQLGRQLVVDAGFAAVFLIAITALSVIKPWGRTAFGRPATGAAVMPSAISERAWQQLRLILIILAVLVAVAFVGLHVLGGMAPHGH